MKHYAVLFQGKVVGHTALEHVWSSTGTAIGSFSPAFAFDSAREALRLYGPAIVEVQPGGAVRWRTREGSDLPPSEITLINTDGTRLPCSEVRICWPGDFPGQQEFQVMAEITDSEFWRREGRR